MNSYEYLMNKRDECIRKALESEGKDTYLYMFFKNAACEFERRAREQTVRL